MNSLHAEPTAASTSSPLRQPPSCPCCVFLNQDLFLPPPLATDAAGTPETEGKETASREVVAPQESLQCIADYALHMELHSYDNTKAPILLVDTHNHAHLKRERHAAYTPQQPSDYSDNTTSKALSALSVVSLTLAVEAVDWDDALSYAAQGDHGITTAAAADSTLMGLGIHPWYLTDIEPDGPWKDRLEDLLLQHPSAIVGEIGLCKMAKCARSHPEGKTRGFAIQRLVLEAQLDLATKHRRPVSIHCVQQHGVFLELLQEKLGAAQANTTPGDEFNNKSAFMMVPPAMAMHSFTGTAHHVKALLQWEATLFGEGPNDSKKKKKRRQTHSEAGDATPPPPPPQRPRPPLLYFGFSHIVNYDMCTSEKARRQGRDAVRAVPRNRLLAESDVHHPLDVPAGTAGAIAYLAWALERPIPEVAELTATNGLAFLQSHLR